MTPTSVDPVVATLFACRYLTKGPAAVLVAMRADFRDRLDGPNLRGFAYELAVNIDLPPPEFEARCRYRVPVADSVAALGRLGYPLPSKLPDLGALTEALKLSPRMTGGDIDRYVEMCQRLVGGG